MVHLLCVCAALLFGIGSLEIVQGFPTSSVAPSSGSGNTTSSPSCVGGSTESNLTLVCNLQYQLTILLKRYNTSNLAINPVWYGPVLNNRLTATDDCRLPFHKQLNVYNHLFERVKLEYARVRSRKFKNLTQRQITAIASLQDKLKASCTADGEDGCSEMNRDHVPAEASNAAIEAQEDTAHAWGLGLVETLLKRLEPLDNGCSSNSRRRRRRGERKDRTKKNRRRGGRKNRRQRKNKKADKKADKKTKDRSEKRGGRAERREKRRRNRKSRVDDDNSTEVNNAITAATTTTNNDNNDKVVTDASEHAVGISTNDVEQVNINVANGKDSSSSDSDAKKKRRNRRRDRKNKDKRRDSKNRDKKRRKSKGRRNRRRKSSSS
ncbi:hypothetical protein V1264_013265 [Littorina saxatilis]|uniref:Uncharacterized protein n=2 Tax=Littorina saxatilis TaxID=31220 RepID=A0AAN9BP47_9CAEN